MKKVFAVFGFMLLLAGCATTQGYERKLNTWVGAPESALYQQWGIPAKTMDTADGKIVEYVFINGASSSSSYNAVTRTVDTNSTQRWCKTTFNLDKSGVVRTWRWEGNTCVAQD